MNGTRYEFHPPYWCDVDVIATFDNARVLIVRPQGGGPVTGARYFDVWVGTQDERQNMGRTNTEDSARWYASNFAPTARPSSDGYAATTGRKP